MSIKITGQMDAADVMTMGVQSAYPPFAVYSDEEWASLSTKFGILLNTGALDPISNTEFERVIDSRAKQRFLDKFPLSDAKLILKPAIGGVPVINIVGYPWSVKISDAAMATAIPDDVAAWFPNSNTTDDSDPDNPVTTRNTFGEAVAAMTRYNTHQSTVDTETVIANLGNLFDMAKAMQLDAISGVSLITLDEFNTFVAANSTPE